MKIAWTKGLAPERVTEVRKDFVGSVVLRKRLMELLEDKMRVSRESSISKDAYSNPNWAYLQADARGYERALNEVISLIESEK